jgi:hypothetical protein
MTPLLFQLVGAIARQAQRSFQHQTQKTDIIQAKFLKSLLQTNENTELGKDLGLAPLKSVDDFRKHVPVSKYDTYQPYVERAFQGDANILTPDPVLYFGMSSGSTGSPKMLPITQRSRRAVSRANQVAMGFAAEAACHHHRPLGKMLFSNSAMPYGYSPQGVAYGPISASDLRLTNALFQQIFAYPFDILRIQDSTTRSYLTLLFALRDRQLRLISATFPVYALTLCQTLETQAESLIATLRSNLFPEWLKLEPTVRRRLERQWNPSPSRATELERILQAQGRLRPKDVWPHLSFLITARGGTSNFYLDRFSDYFGDVPIFGGTYASSEATYGVHRAFGTDGVILAVNSGFYEFIPESEWNREQPQTCLPHELNVGDRYRIVVTALNGLYRYDVGDVVKVEGFYNSAPIFVFCHRQGGVLSATSEKTTEQHVLQTIQQLQQTFDITLENFCVTLSKQGIPPHYLLNIELAPDKQLHHPEQFLRHFDSVLSQIHPSYGKKRPDLIPNPRLRLLAPGSFQQLRQHAMEKGTLDTQVKLPHLSDNRDYLDGVTVEQEICFALASNLVE